MRVRSKILLFAAAAHQSERFGMVVRRHEGAHGAAWVGPLKLVRAGSAS